MSNAPGDSPQAVALQLVSIIQSARSEQSEQRSERTQDFRAYYLDLYAECLDATKGNRGASFGGL